MGYNKDLGALPAEPDRATRQSPSPTVSALRASIPSADCEHLFEVVRAPDATYFAVRESRPRFVIHGASVALVAQAAVDALACFSTDEMHEPR